MLTGIGSTLLLPETKGFSLEELSNESQDGFVKGTNREFLSESLVIVILLMPWTQEKMSPNREQARLIFNAHVVYF